MLKFFNITRNQYFVIGFIVGLLLSLYLPQDIKEEFAECPELATADAIVNEEFEPQLNLAQKPMQAKKVVKNIVRPRYYSSELGIREKLFVGLLTSQENIDTFATAFNKTAAHLVNKIKYFINADNVKSNFKLKNIVGFTDTREKLRPFHVLKYIADNYLDDYDYFLIITDSGYLNARDLKEKLSHISISFDIYMGRKLENVEENYRNYCDINAGIILSSSVIKKIRTNLDWCVRNAETDFHSFNIGRCIKYSTKIDECQSEWQGVEVTSYKMHSSRLYRELHIFAEDSNFNNASIVYPLQSPNDFYLLHAYFSRLKLDQLQEQYEKNELEASKIANGTISKDVLEMKWPLGVPESAPGETRHDIIPWTLLNMTHSFLYDAENNVKKLSDIDAEDIKKIVDRTLIEAQGKEPSLTFVDLHSAYRRFDPVRGMDYRLHLNFFDQKSKTQVLKSFEVVKPLGLIEIVPSPYVTESTRVAILLPTFKTQIQEANNFIKHYEKVCMENQDNTFLMLVFMYPAEAPSKGEEDIFVDLKTLALDLSEKYKSDNSRIAWVSIRLPPEFVDPSPSIDDVSLTSTYGAAEILSLAVTDLALRKIGLESLVMVGSNAMTFKADYLNRVRMNTIQGFQVFAPIAFMTYPCRFTGLCKECPSCDVGQSAGYFDRKNYDVISFYSRDYVDARKKLEFEIPIVHADHDIVNLFNRTASMDVKIVDLFLQSDLPLHVLRAVEPNLRLGVALENYLTQQQSIPGSPVHLPVCQFRNTKDYENCIKYGSRKQLGEAIVMAGDAL